MNPTRTNAGNTLPLLRIFLPLVAWGIYITGEFVSWTPFIIFSGLALINGVLNAVYHAEVIARRIGQPYGAMLLAIAVTVIEVALIVSFMFTGGHDVSVLARDTVFATVMIILNGMIGLTLLIGGIKFKEQGFMAQGINSALTVLVAISVLTLILPNFTTTVAGPFYSSKQLIFVAFVTFLLYSSFLFVQNIRHRSHFLSGDEGNETEEEKPALKTTILSGVLLPVNLIVVVLLAESIAPHLTLFIQSVGAPISLSGVIIASVILLPEGISAVKAARKNQLQKSLNISLGSALASIGLTLPTVALVSVFTGMPLALGISVESTVLFLLSLFVIILSFSTGKTSILQGIILLVIFAVYLFTILIP
ncbi:MAG: ionic transporter y4hA [Bacteroidota bacterium]